MTILLFPLWALLFSVISYFFPHLFISFKSSIIPLLSIIMLTMGLTLKLQDFQKVVYHRRALVVGVCLQFLVMPLAALLITKLFHFDNELTIGMLLVGGVAGGTASNVMCYLAKGDTALSISMTALSTLLGVVFTPLIVALLVGQGIDIPVKAMLISLVKIVIVPVTLGVILNTFLSEKIGKIQALLPYVSMFSIVFIIAIVVALSADRLADIGYLLLLAVMLHNFIGLLLGYCLTRLLGFNEKVCRAIAFEVGMQNSGLATALAIKFFTPVAALPGTIFSIWHNVTGSLLAGYWNKHKAIDCKEVKCCEKVLK